MECISICPRKHHTFQATICTDGGQNVLWVGQSGDWTLVGAGFSVPSRPT